LAWWIEFLGTALPSGKPVGSFSQGDLKMRTVNLEYFAKSILAMFFVGLVSGCGGEPEEVAKQDQDAEMVAEFSQSDEFMTDPIAPAEPITPAEPMTPAEPVEETLESILEKADEIIQKTESSVSAMNGADAKAEIGEIATGIAEESESFLASVEEPSRDLKKAADDGLDVVKATPELIRNIQEALAERGFNPGAVDGKLGPRTLGALNSFQQENELTIGKINKETLRELGVSF
jgi:hypothetical protein